VRVSESWIYTNLITGEQPDLEQGKTMMHLVIDGAMVQPKPTAGR
jgi:hypothetical protein